MQGLKDKYMRYIQETLPFPEYNDLEDHLALDTVKILLIQMKTLDKAKATKEGAGIRLFRMLHGLLRK